MPVNISKLILTTDIFTALGIKCQVMRFFVPDIL